jgi:hypothetical protein
MRQFTKAGLIASFLILVLVVLVAIIYLWPESPEKATKDLIERASPVGSCVLSISGATRPLSGKQTEGFLKVLGTRPDVRSIADDPGPVAMGAVTIGGKDQVLLYGTVFVWHHGSHAFVWPCDKLVGIDELVRGMSPGDEGKAAATVAGMFER